MMLLLELRYRLSEDIALKEMSQKFKQGDKVEWSSGGGTSTGTVQKRITESKKVDGNSVSASEDDPRYIVENDNTGNKSGHKPDALSEANDSKGDASDSDSDQSDRGSKNSSSKSSSSKNSDSKKQSDNEEKIKEFNEAVNMTASEIEDWLDTDKSQSVGQKDDNGNIKGRESGKHIIEILNKNKSDYTEEDMARMKKVVAYVHRHTAQKPSGDIKETDWRYSLMNWGHDPCK